jgi:hypothetical protein
MHGILFLKSQCNAKSEPSQLATTLNKHLIHNNKFINDLHMNKQSNFFFNIFFALDNIYVSLNINDFFF